MRVPLSALIIALLTAPLAAAGAQAPIAASVAPLFVGEEKVVEGVVTAVAKDANVATLQLGMPPHALTVSLVIGLLTRFPSNPEVHYAGKTVRVGGTIQRFRDTIEMTIRDPRNIEVVDLDATPPDPKLREEHEAMRQRVQSLEERIRQLEAVKQNEALPAKP